MEERAARAPEPALPVMSAPPGDATDLPFPSPISLPAAPGSAQRKGLQVLIDLLAVTIAVLLAYVVWLGGAPHPYMVRSHLGLGLLSLPVWVVAFSRFRLYSARTLSSRADEFRRVAKACVVGLVGLAALAFAFKLDLSRIWLLLVFAFAVPLVCIDRALTRLYFARLRRVGRMLRPVLVVGGNAEAQSIAAMLDTTPDLGYQVLGFVDDGHPAGSVLFGEHSVLGAVGDAVDVVRASAANTVVIATTAIDASAASRLARDLTEIGVHVEMSSGLRDIAAQRLTVRALGRHPVFYIEPTVRHGWRGAAKRTFDCVVATLVLVLLAPVMLVAAVAVRLTSKGPVLFRQERVGRHGATFSVFKFRSMVVDAEARLRDLVERNEVDGPLFKMKDDPRITPLGRLLRKTSLDELPQLFNVLRGDMSLVGPRPALPGEITGWSPDLYNRLRVRPGITGMWQVNSRGSSSFEDYVRLDLYYVDNWTLSNDLGILARTIPAVLFAKGAH